ncbi:hypothetical protein ACSQ67_009059 [Phaseolus vulgaris]
MTSTTSGKGKQMERGFVRSSGFGGGGGGCGKLGTGEIAGSSLGATLILGLRWRFRRSQRYLGGRFVLLSCDDGGSPKKIIADNGDVRPERSLGKWNGGASEVDTEASSDDESVGASLCDSVGSELGLAGDGGVGAAGEGGLELEETVRGMVDRFVLVRGKRSSKCERSGGGFKVPKCIYEAVQREFECSGWLSRRRRRRSRERLKTDEFDGVDGSSVATAKDIPKSPVVQGLNDGGPVDPEKLVDARGARRSEMSKSRDGGCALLREDY